MKESVVRRTQEVGQQMFPREVQTDIHWPETMREQSAPMISSRWPATSIEPRSGYGQEPRPKQQGERSRRKLMSREQDTTRFYTKLYYILFP